jgi:acetylornithine deacetylase/succinyl-diaminopimelate desuccinylase-like protein
LLTGETEESVLDALRSLPALAGIAAVVAEGDYDTYTGARLRGPKFFPAWEVAPDHELVAWALAGLHQAGLAPGSRAYRFCTNAAQSAGRDCIPTIGFGPSAEGQAHVVDEYIELEQLFAATRGYMGIIEAILSPSS